MAARAKTDHDVYELLGKNYKLAFSWPTWISTRLSEIYLANVNNTDNFWQMCPSFLARHPCVLSPLRCNCHCDREIVTGREVNEVHSIVFSPQMFMENQYMLGFVLGSGDKGITGQTMFIPLQS